MFAQEASVAAEFSSVTAALSNPDTSAATKRTLPARVRELATRCVALSPHHALTAQVTEMCGDLAQQEHDWTLAVVHRRSCLMAWQSIGLDQAPLRSVAYVREQLADALVASGHMTAALTHYTHSHAALVATSGFHSAQAISIRDKRLRLLQTFTRALSDEGALPRASLSACSLCDFAPAHASELTTDDIDISVESAQTTSLSSPTPTAAATLLVCARCQTTAYCGKACQKAHWAVHKTVCSKTK